MVLEKFKQKRVEKKQVAEDVSAAEEEIRKMGEKTVSLENKKLAGDIAKKEETESLDQTISELEKSEKEMKLSMKRQEKELDKLRPFKKEEENKQRIKARQESAKKLQQNLDAAEKEMDRLKKEKEEEADLTFDLDEAKIVPESPRPRGESSIATQEEKREPEPMKKPSKVEKTIGVVKQKVKSGRKERSQKNGGETRPDSRRETMERSERNIVESNDASRRPNERLKKVEEEKANTPSGPRSERPNPDARPAPEPEEPKEKEPEKSAEEKAKEEVTSQLNIFDGAKEELIALGQKEGVDIGNLDKAFTVLLRMPRLRIENAEQLVDHYHQEMKEASKVLEETKEKFEKARKEAYKWARKRVARDNRAEFAEGLDYFKEAKEAYQDAQREHFELRIKLGVALDGFRQIKEEASLLVPKKDIKKIASNISKMQKYLDKEFKK